MSHSNLVVMWMLVTIGTCGLFVGTITPIMVLLVPFTFWQVMHPQRMTVTEFMDHQINASFQYFVVGMCFAGSGLCILAVAQEVNILVVSFMVPFLAIVIYLYSRARWRVSHYQDTVPE